MHAFVFKYFIVVDSNLTCMHALMFVVSSELNFIVKLLSIPKQNASFGCGDRGRGRSIIGGGGGGGGSYLYIRVRRL